MYRVFENAKLNTNSIPLVVVQRTSHRLTETLLAGIACVCFDDFVDSYATTLRVKK